MVIKETMVMDVVENKNYRGKWEHTHNSYKRKYFIPPKVEPH
jgi:hypothetical protein